MDQDFEKQRVLKKMSLKSIYFFWKNSKQLFGFQEKKLEKIGETNNC